MRVTAVIHHLDSDLMTKLLFSLSRYHWQTQSMLSYVHHLIRGFPDMDTSFM